MTEKRLISTLFILLSICSFSQINTYGTFYTNLAVSKKGEDWLYSNLNLFYLKLIKPSRDDYELRSNLSFAVYKIPGVDSMEFNIQRLNFETDILDFQFKMGRFLPRYHYTNFFRPLDVFLGPEFFRQDVIYEGIDGFLLRKFFGGMTSLEYVWKPEVKITESSHLLNLTSNYKSFDFSLMGLYSGEEEVFKPGLGFKGDIGISLFNETLFSFRDGVDSVNITSSTGVDYSFGQFMTMVEYLYNGGSRYRQMETGLSLSGEHYLFLNAFHFIPMGRSMGGSAILNLSDRSAIFSLFYENEILHGVNFSGGIYIPYSEESSDEFSSERLGSFILNFYLKAKF